MQRMQIRLNRAALWLVTLLLAAGCASPPHSDAWRDPNYAGGPFRKIFVIGLSSKDLTDRRGFEDLMVGTLRNAGVQAVPAYQYLANDGPADQASMLAAFQQSGADAVLMARFMGFHDKNSADMVVMPNTGFDNVPDTGMYVAYSGWYAVPGDQQYEVATIFTTLFNGKTMNPVWTWSPKTFDASSMQQQAAAFANDVVRRLQVALLVLPQ
jgi:hypothetical protein